MRITKNVIFIAKEDCVAELKALLKTMVDASKAEDGCELYEIFQVKAEPTKFVVIETWRDEAALKGHQLSAHYAHYKANFEPYCAAKSSDELDYI